MGNPNFPFAGGGSTLVDAVVAPGGAAHVKAAGTPIPVAGFDDAAAQLMDLNAYIAAPTPLSFGATTGTLSAGSKYYRVSAVTASGETIPCTEQSFVAGATTGIVISWPRVAGATGYRIYGRGTGSETLLATIDNGTTLSWTDDGSLSPSGAMPTVNTAQPTLPVVVVAPAQAPVQDSADGANTPLTATLPGVTGKTTYISGFQVTGGGATAASIITITVTGLVGVDQLYRLAIPAGVTLGVVPLLVTFATPIPASGPDTDVVINVDAFGTGNTDASVAAQGYQA